MPVPVLAGGVESCWIDLLRGVKKEGGVNGDRRMNNRATHIIRDKG
jgi:hypothetical protein